MRARAHRAGEDRQTDRQKESGEGDGGKEKDREIDRRRVERKRRRERKTEAEDMEVEGGANRKVYWQSDMGMNMIEVHYTSICKVRMKPNIIYS